MTATTTNNNGDDDDEKSENDLESLLRNQIRSKKTQREEDDVE
jgi:hypothetical protein